jgi:hypothetical protein
MHLVLDAIVCELHVDQFGKPYQPDPLFGLNGTEFGRRPEIYCPALPSQAAGMQANMQSRSTQMPRPCLRRKRQEALLCGISPPTWRRTPGSFMAITRFIIQHGPHAVWFPWVVQWRAVRKQSLSDLVDGFAWTTGPARHTISSPHSFKWPAPCPFFCLHDAYCASSKPVPPQRSLCL